MKLIAAAVILSPYLPLFFDWVRNTVKRLRFIILSAMPTRNRSNGCVLAAVVNSRHSIGLMNPAIPRQKTRFSNRNSVASYDTRETIIFRGNVIANYSDYVAKYQRFPEQPGPAVLPTMTKNPECLFRDDE